MKNPELISILDGTAHASFPKAKTKTNCPAQDTGLGTL